MLLVIALDSKYYGVPVLNGADEITGTWIQILLDLVTVAEVAKLATLLTCAPCGMQGTRSRLHLNIYCRL